MGYISKSPWHFNLLRNKERNRNKEREVGRTRFSPVFAQINPGKKQIVYEKTWNRRTQCATGVASGAASEAWPLPGPLLGLPPPVWRSR